MKKIFAAVRKGDIETVKKLLEKQPDLVHCIAVAPPKSDDGQSLLQVALKRGELEIADYLINNGADINYMESEECMNVWRMPVIHDAINAAIMNSRWNTYSADSGFDVYSTKEDADLSYSILEKMLMLGADVNAPDSYGNTGIWRAFIQTSQIIPSMDNITGELSNERRFTAELEKDLKRVFSLLLKHGADLSYIRPDLGMTVRELHTNKLFERLLQ